LLKNSQPELTFVDYILATHVINDLLDGFLNE